MGLKKDHFSLEKEHGRLETASLQEIRTHQQVTVGSIDNHHNLNSRRISQNDEVEPAKQNRLKSSQTHPRNKPNVFNQPLYYDMQK